MANISVVDSSTVELVPARVLSTSLPSAVWGDNKAGSIGDRPDLAAQRIHVQCLILLR